MYSKRWELVHILGGECTHCGNQNFYDLEIDHIHDDGDGERRYYTNFAKRYTQNPNRAKQRLQILCKKCHERKGIPTSTPKPANIYEIRSQTFMDIVKELEGEHRTPIPHQKLVDKIVRWTDNQLKAEAIIMRHLREASIYESKVGHYSTV